MAAVGNMSGLFKPVERLFVISHRVDPEVTSLLLPEVVGTAMKRQAIVDQFTLAIDIISHFTLVG